MGKYVYAAQQRAANDLPHSIGDLTTEDGASQSQSTCPFATMFRAAPSRKHLSDVVDDGASVLDVLSHDPRVSSELAVNLVMALFRTGIDSVRKLVLIRLYLSIARLLVNNLEGVDGVHHPGRERSLRSTVFSMFPVRSQYKNPTIKVFNLKK